MAGAAEMLQEPTRRTRAFVFLLLGAVYAFRKGLITEGELARLLRVDRLTAREEVQRHTDPLHSEEEGFPRYESDLGKRLVES